MSSRFTVLTLNCKNNDFNVNVLIITEQLPLIKRYNKVAVFKTRISESARLVSNAKYGHLHFAKNFTIIRTPALFISSQAYLYMSNE